MFLILFKAAKYEIQKPSFCRATLFRCKFSSNISRFSPCVINLTRNKNICCGLKKVVAKSRARVYFEQQILVSLLVFHRTRNLSRNKFARARANQQISVLHFFNPQQMFLLRVILCAQQMFTILRAQGNVMSNNASATMFLNTVEQMYRNSLKSRLNVLG